MRNLYEVLGVPRDADQAKIRKAFRAQARKYHPDVNKSPDAEQRFKELNAAYEVLSDEQRRSWYDEFGEEALRPGFNVDAARQWRQAARGPFGGGPGGSGPGPGGPGFGGFGAGGPGFGGMDVDDLFGSLFGHGGGRGRRASTATARRRGADMEARVEVDLLQAVRGGEVLLDVRRPQACPTCGGQGGTGRQTCPRCQGSGRVTERRFGFQAVVLCDECAGAGSVFTAECETCAGSGRVMSDTRIRVHVPPGVADGQVLRLRGLGGEGVDGGPPGHLLVTVGVRPHPLLRRQGADLELDLPLTVREALEGGMVTVPTPDGDLKVRIPPRSNTGQVLRIRGRGMPVPGGGRGNLLLVLRPVLPDAEDPDLVDLARKMDAAYRADVRQDLRL